MDITNNIIIAEILALIGIVVTMAYFFIKLGLYKFEPRKKKAVTPKNEEKK